jgi:hypothetical protein
MSSPSLPSWPDFLNENFQGVWSPENHKVTSLTCCNTELQPNIPLLLQTSNDALFKADVSPNIIHTMVFFGQETMTMKPIHYMVVLYRWMKIVQSKTEEQMECKTKISSYNQHTFVTSRTPLLPCKAKRKLHPTQLHSQKSKAMILIAMAQLSL